MSLAEKLERKVSIRLKRKLIKAVEFTLLSENEKTSQKNIGFQKKFQEIKMKKLPEIKKTFQKIKQFPDI